MALTVEKLHPLFAAEVSGIDLSRKLDQADLAGFIAAMDEYAVCVVHHEAPLSDAQHIAFSEQLGPIERGRILEIAGAGEMRIPHHEIIDQSNLGADGEIFREGNRTLGFKRANRLWHTDISFHPVRATYSALSAHVVPPGGADTEFADMRAAYDALPQATKVRIASLEAGGNGVFRCSRLCLQCSSSVAVSVTPIRLMLSKELLRSNQTNPSGARAYTWADLRDISRWDLLAA